MRLQFPTFSICQFLFHSFCSLLIAGCNSNQESQIDEAKRLFFEEKYEQAKDILEEILWAPRPTDQIISNTTPDLPRILRLSQDRNRVVWSEDEKIIYRDLANPTVKNIKLPSKPNDIQISTDAKFMIVSLKLNKLKGCRQIVYAWDNPNQFYESGAHISCKNSNAVNIDGSTIYYFIDDSLYSENTTLPQKPNLLFTSEKFSSPYPKLKNKYHLVPLGDEFLLFSGNGGAYNLYFFQPRKKKIDLLSKNIHSPKVYPADEKSVFVIGGSIGSMMLKEISYTPSKLPTVDFGILISHQEAVSWRLSNRFEFLSLVGNSVFRWSPAKPKTYYPILVERFWGVARDMLIIENQKGHLLLADTEYNPEEWEVLELYKTVKKKASE